MRCKVIVTILFLTILAVPVLAQEGTEADSVLQEKYRYYDEAVNPDIYLIRPGEKLVITFLKAKIPTFWLQVNPEGRIVEKNLGVFELAGKTLSEVRQILHDPIQKLYNAQEFEISVREPYKVAIMVTGHVKNPGMYIGFTSMRVSEIIEMADGIDNRGSSRNIVFDSDNHQLPVDLDKVEYLGSNKYNPCLYAGIRLVVPARSDKTVTVIGEVYQPRTIELLPEDNLSGLIDLAGGFDELADRESVHAVADPGRDLTKPGNILSKDIIIVPASPEKSDVVLLYGAVNMPGRYPFSPGMTLQALLSNAGGVLSGANKPGIVIFRKNQNNYWQGSGQTVYPVTIGRENPDALGNIPLNKGDSVFVPVLQGFVKVSGAVRRPGYFPFNEDKSVQFYFDLAGGLTNDANRERIRIIDNLSGAGMESSLGTTVKDADEIVVPREETK